MKELLTLVNCYNKEKHVEIIKKSINIENYTWEVKPIYDNNWGKLGNEKLPYETITHILDSYYQLPERPDLAFLFCWQAINNSYNELLLNESSKSRLNDTDGLKLLIDKIECDYESNYKKYLREYINKIPIKLCKYIANYLIKGYVIHDYGFAPKYNNSAYFTFCKNFRKLSDDIKASYGNAFKNLCTPKIINNKVDFGIVDKNKSYRLIEGASKKIQELISTGKVQFQNQDKSVIFNQSLSNKETLTMLIISVLYGSRCNNFHGNVASRLNSIYSNDTSYISYKYVYLLAHIILGISLNVLGYLSDFELENLEINNKYL